MAGQAAEQADQLLALVFVERFEQVVLGLAEQGVEALQLPASVRRDGDDVTATVAGVGGTLGEPAVGELIDGGDEVAPVDAVAANVVAMFVTGTSPSLTVGERYRFTAVRTGEGWRFSSVEAVPVWRSGT